VVKIKYQVQIDSVLHICVFQ